jgi:hypothetical protein
MDTVDTNTNSFLSWTELSDRIRIRTVDDVSNSQGRS